jgi:hypothetical protein
MFPDLARLFFRVTGAFASAAWFNGLFGFNWSLFMLAHVVILSTIATIVAIDVQTSVHFFSYFVWLPLFALGYVLLATLELYLLKLPQLLPLARYFVREFNSPAPSVLLVILNLIGWAATAVLPAILYEAIFPSSPLLALILAIAVPAAVWIIWALIWWFGLPEAAIFGSRLDATGKAVGDESVWRALVFYGAYHTAQNLAVGLAAYISDDWTVTWIVALAIWGVELILTVILYFVSSANWKRPPRTGYVDNVEASSASTPLLPQSEEATGRGFRGSSTVNQRTPVFESQRGTSVFDSKLGAKKD